MTRLRIAFAIAGFLAALLSVALDDQRVAWIAIALLMVSLALRLVLRRRGRGSDPAEPPL
jgi:uncharacterized membrane protein YfcA